VKLPKIELGPKPKRWDLITLAAALAGLALAGFNWWLARRSATGVSTAATLALATAQLAVCCGCLMLLGKTAKEGTLWGNLAAVFGMFLGLSGVLLAAAMWVAA
jgi:uncharacterized membrane protein